MLVAAGRKLYFHVQKSKNEAQKRMEIDFLIAKSKIQHRKNISAQEVKSGKNYTLTSLKKSRNLELPRPKQVKVEMRLCHHLAFKDLWRHIHEAYPPRMSVRAA